MDEKILTGGMTGTILGVTGTGLAVTEVQQIVSMAATIIGLLITITTAIIIPVWKSVRAAKKDGKITPEEMEDIVKTTKDGIDKIEDELKDEDDKEDK